MEITRSSTDGATAKGPAEWFTGDVYIDSVAGPGCSVPRAGEPGPLHAGRPHGLASSSARAEPVEVIRPGDRVYIEPDEEHWHGATPSRLMVHLALNEVDDEHVAVHWGEHVTDDEYNATPDTSQA